jgi:hypothetical protein
MYSLIGLNELGGIVEINNSLFSHFRTNGAVIKFKKDYFSTMQFDWSRGINLDGYDEIEYEFELIYKNKFGYSGSETWEYLCGEDVDFRCFEITISNTEFKYMEFEKDLHDDDQFIQNAEHPMRQHGSILSFDQFPGDIIITDCTFQ